jgi:hypothetical protein
MSDLVDQIAKLEKRAMDLKESVSLPDFQFSVEKISGSTQKIR